jgi:hypothetical protein
LDICLIKANNIEQYRTINCARSALSSTLKTIDGFKVGQHPVVTGLMRGVFNSKPPQPKICAAWSVIKVLDLLHRWGPATSLDLKSLTFKSVMWHGMLEKVSFIGYVVS